ncbi:hypothetical protein FS837_010161 [Tulasnella sp. UAMH 9824]|nr:hypothetical protein FS837_010161 [Tulasnella sp. UAMH 9824]
MSRFLASRRARNRRRHDSGDVVQTLSQSSAGGDRPSTMQRISDFLRFKRSGHHSRHQRQQASPPPLGNKTGVRAQESNASQSPLAGTSGSQTGQRQQNALGLYIAHPSLQSMSSPHLASTATPASSLLATPVTPHTKTALPDPVASLHAELANVRSRIKFMEQNWVPKAEVEDRVRALVRRKLAAEERRKESQPSMTEGEAMVKEKLERRIMELENEVRILKARLLPVASFVDLRPKPQRQLDLAPTSYKHGVPTSWSSGSMNTVDEVTDNPVDGVVNRDSLVRSNNTTSSNGTSLRSMSFAQQTFGRHRPGRSNTFGYSTNSGELSSRPTSSRHDSRRELTSPLSQMLLPAQPQPEAQQEEVDLAESTTSTPPDAGTREAATPTPDIDEMLLRLSVDHSAFLQPITSRPSTLLIASNLRERRQRARSSAGYSTPSIYSEHISLAQSRISPAPSAPSNLQAVDSALGQHVQVPDDGNAEPEDSSPAAPVANQRECTAPEDHRERSTLRLAAGDRSFVGHDQIPSQPGSPSPTKSEQRKVPDLRPPARRQRSPVALIDWTPPTDPQ